MKANELMLGDWVTYPDGKPSRVFSIWDTNVNVDWNPIPLTSEILEENGFEPVFGGYECKKRTIFGERLYVCINEDFSTFTVERGCVGFVTPHVHQLQHALLLLVNYSSIFSTALQRY